MGAQHLGAKSRFDQKSRIGRQVGQKRLRGRARPSGANWCSARGRRCATSWPRSGGPCDQEMRVGQHDAMRVINASTWGEATGFSRPMLHGPEHSLPSVWRGQRRNKPRFFRPRGQRATILARAVCGPLRWRKGDQQAAWQETPGAVQKGRGNTSGQPPVWLIAGHLPIQLLP